MDISLRSDTYSSTIMINTMEGLVRMEERDGDYFLAPVMLQMESNEDGTVWTFYLGDNKWEDGVPVTADQYVYSLRRSSALKLVRPTATSSPLSRILLKSTGELPVEELGVRAIDEKTLEITLTEPLPSFLSMMNATVYYPQRQDKIEEW